MLKVYSSRALCICSKEHLDRDGSNKAEASSSANIEKVMSSNTNTKSSAAVKPKTPIRAPFKMKPSRPLKSKSTKSQGAEADPGQAAVVLPAKDTESPKSQATKGLQGPDGPKALDGTKTPERVKGRDGVKTPDSVKGPKGVGDSTASKGEETDTSQAEHTEDAIKVTPKATEKKNKSKPVSPY